MTTKIIDPQDGNINLCVRSTLGVVRSFDQNGHGSGLVWRIGGFFPPTQHEQHCDRYILNQV